jgi:hypothetical protein
MDVTMGSAPSVESWLVNLGLAAYSVQVVISPVSRNDAVRWADTEHRRGHEAYRRGQGYGGRYVPPEAILAAARLAEALAGSDWAAILRQVGSQREVAFPASELLGLARAYRDGRLTLEDLGRQLRARRLQPVYPPGLEEAKPALDDLEPWAAGSFDEIVLACDLGILTDDDYAALVAAIAS